MDGVHSLRVINSPFPSLSLGASCNTPHCDLVNATESNNRVAVCLSAVPGCCVSVAGFVCVFVCCMSLWVPMWMSECPCPDMAYVYECGSE